MTYEALVQELRECAESEIKPLFKWRALCYRAAAAIDILDRICDGYEDENQKLRNERLKAERERDVAVKQLHGYCPACKNYTENQCDGPCSECKHEYYQYKDASSKDNWQWRGVQEGT